MNLIRHEMGMTECSHWFADPKEQIHMCRPPPVRLVSLAGAGGSQDGVGQCPRCPQLPAARAASRRVHPPAGTAGQVCRQLVRQQCGSCKAAAGHGARCPPVPGPVPSPASLGCLHPPLVLAVGTRPGGAVWHRGVWKHPWKKQSENSAALSLPWPSLYNSHLCAGLRLWRKRWWIKG